MTMRARDPYDSDERAQRACDTLGTRSASCEALKLDSFFGTCAGGRARGFRRIAGMADLGVQSQDRIMARPTCPAGAWRQRSRVGASFVKYLRVAARAIASHPACHEVGDKTRAGDMFRRALPRWCAATIVEVCPDTNLAEDMTSGRKQPWLSDWCLAFPLQDEQCCQDANSGQHWRPPVLY